MDRERSFDLSARIGKLIAERAPVVGYTDEEVRRAEAEMTAEERAELREAGLLGEDFAAFFVMEKFVALTGLAQAADGAFLARLFSLSRRLDADEFERDGYLARVAFPPVRCGPFDLTSSTYERGEILQYDMPDLRARTVVPPLGFFDRAVRFPTLCENGVPWISVCPSEINSMKGDIAAAHGRVLVLGLGLGYFPFHAAQKEDVTEIVAVELRDEVIGLFETYLRPLFVRGDKIRIVHSDAVSYLRQTEAGRFDFCFADLWQGAVDGAPLYRALKAEEARLGGTEFRYWIGEQIETYLSGAF